VVLGARSCVFFQAEDGIRDATVTGVQTCALPIYPVIVGGVISRPIYWLAKVEYVITPKVAWFFKSVGVIPVNRDAPEHEALEKEIGRASCRERGGVGGVGVVVQTERHG